MANKYLFWYFKQASDQSFSLVDEVWNTIIERTAKEIPVTMDTQLQVKRTKV